MEPVIIGLLGASFRTEMMRIGTQDQEHAGFDLIRISVLGDMQPSLPNDEQIKDADVLRLGCPL